MEDTSTRNPWDYKWSFSFSAFNGGDLETGWVGYNTDTGKEEVITYELAMLIREYNTLWSAVKTLEDGT